MLHDKFSNLETIPSLHLFTFSHGLIPCCFPVPGPGGGEGGTAGGGGPDLRAARSRLGAGGHRPAVDGSHPPLFIVAHRGYCIDFDRAV